MAFTYAQLKTEITTDPAALGLVVDYNAGRDGAVADKLNAVANLDVTRTLIPAYEVLSAIVPSEWTAAGFTTANKQMLQTLLSQQYLDASNANIRAWFTTMFAAGTTTRTNLAALQTRKGSRAEVAFGIDTRISAADVAAARLA
jgi:hypothetical protein